MDSFLERLWRRSFWIQALSVVLAAELSLLLLVNMPVESSPRDGDNAVAATSASTFLDFDRKVEVGVFATIPLFLLTILQVSNAIRVQRAGFVKDFMARLYTDTELLATFDYLVERYPNSVYEQLMQDKDAPKVHETYDNRPEGGRIFNPRTFQGTIEARRLDALLGYFNVIGYHYFNGVISMKDIAGILGYHLAALSTRKPITIYVNSLPEFWAASSYSAEGIEPVGPFRYLTILLDDFRDYNRVHQHKIKRINRRQL